MLITYVILILLAVDYKNFGLRRPVFFNINLNFAVILAQFTVMYFYIIRVPANDDIGMPHKLVLFHVLPLFIILFLKRHRFGYIFVLAAVLLSLCNMTVVYETVDNINYSFIKDMQEINRTICAVELTNMTADLESAKMNLSETDEIRFRKINDQILDTSSEIYLLMKKNFGWDRSLKSYMKKSVRLWHTKVTGIYKLEEVMHHYYIKGGDFKDISIYCDNVTSYEVESAVKKALADFKKMQKK